MAPGITGRGDRIYKVAHNLIKSHAKAYRAYEKEFKDKQKGNRDHNKSRLNKLHVLLLSN